MKKDKFDFRGWFDEEVKELENDPDYIANGLMIELAAQVARKLKKEDLMQKDLAKRLGKSEGWISRFMNDPTNFSVKKLVEIAVALGMELDIRFRETAAVADFNPRTVEGKPKSGPTRQLKFEDVDSSAKIEKSVQAKRPKGNGLAA